MVDTLIASSFPLITFLDVEASGLEQPDSYPVEIGWSDTLGNGDGFLIRPFRDWKYWDPAAESIHRIGRDELFGKGLSVNEAAERLNNMLGCETVFCDGLASDKFWISKLFVAANIEPSFQLDDFYQLHKLLSNEHMLSLQNVLKDMPILHRAQADAARYARATIASYQDLYNLGSRRF